MWRFILVSFGFLGFAFYELSGGSDYAPRGDSLQVHWQENRAQRLVEAETRRALAAARAAEPVSEPVVTADASEANQQAAAIDAALVAALEAEKSGDTGTEIASQTTATLAELKDTGEDDTRVEVTLAAATDLGMGFTLAGLTADATPLPGETLVDARQEATETVTDVAINATPADIRSVTGNLVNMRAGPGTFYEKVTQLRQGTRVEVIDSSPDGWLYLRVADTGTEGWMANWLVTAAN